MVAGKQPIRPWSWVLGFLLDWSIPIGLCCGVFAIVIHLVWRDAERSITLYEAGQLILLNVNAGEHTGAHLWAARLFAVLAVLLFGIEVVLQFGGRGINRLRLAFRKHIAPSLRGKRVLVIGAHAHAADFAKSVFIPDSNADWATPLVTHLVCGVERTVRPPDVSNPVLSIFRTSLSTATLRQIGVDRYTDVVVIESQDSVALETLASVCDALKQEPRQGSSSERKLPTIRVRIESPELCANLRRRNWVPRSALGHVRMWCPDDISARRVLSEVDLDATWPFAKPGGKSTIVMIGFGSSNRALAARAIGQMHHVDETPVELHVIDEEAERCWSLFEEAWPGAKEPNAVRRELHVKDPHDAGIRDWIGTLARDPSSNLLIAVSIGDLDANLGLASSVIDGLSAATDHSRAVVLIRQRGIADADGIAGFAKSGDRSQGIQVFAWGDVRSSLSPEDVLEEGLDRTAKEVHAAYLMGEEQREPATWVDRKKKASTDEFSSLRAWEELWPFLRDDNRNCAEFSRRRLEAIGLDLVDGVRPGQGELKPADLTKDELITLARLEHRRWVVNRLMNGWQHGAKKCPHRKIHPDLIAWEQLSDDAKGKDFLVVSGSASPAANDKLSYELKSMERLIGIGKCMIRKGSSRSG